jgi:hypothetical protein
MIASGLFHEVQGDDEHQSRQDAEDGPDAPEADHIRADGEIKPHQQGDEQENKNPRRCALGPSRG